MAKKDICIRLKILNPQRQGLGGTVNLEFKPEVAGDTITVQDADASTNIDVTGLQRMPRGIYQLTVTAAGAAKAVTQTVTIPAKGFDVVEIVVDQCAPTATLSTTVPPPSEWKVYGTVRDALQRPMAGVVVKAVDKDIRTEQPLGRPATTDAAGTYAITYSLTTAESTEDLGAPDIVVRAFGSDGKLLKESGTFFNAPSLLRVDLDLSGQAYAGPSEFDQMVQVITPVAGTLAFADFTEDPQTRDLSFLVNKTGVPRNNVEALAMAYRFVKGTDIQPAVFYALVRQSPASGPLAHPTSTSAAVPFTTKAQLTLAALMEQNIDTLMSSIESAIASNIAPFSLTGNFALIRRQLAALQAAYNKKQPPPQASADLTLKLSIAGLEGKQIAAFNSLFSVQGAAQQDFWKTLAADPAFQAQKVSLLQSVFTLSRLTGEQVVLTDQLIKTQNIKTPDDLPKLAALNAADWAGVLQKSSIQPPPGIPGQTPQEQSQNYAAQLEQSFVKAFPSAAFTSRIQKDAKSPIPHAKELGQFLSANPRFDLLTTRVGKYLQPGPTVAATADAPRLSDQAVHQLKRTQRVFKLTQTYETTAALLGDNLDSAHKVYRMGQGNFVSKYAPLMGESGAKNVYQKAKQAHSQALMLAGNLKSLSDASSMNVFPNYTKTIAEAMTVEVPDLETLFGHADFCECEECRSVYGAAAYLTDLLHFLNNRITSIECKPGHKASLTEALLRRRPDLADIDLNCDNTNTQVPYIDIANEIKEDFIVPPAITVAIGLLPKLVKGKIDGGLLAAITGQFQAANQTNVASLLTANATVSDKYSMERLRNDDTCVTEDHWIIRDQFVVLKATNQGAAIGVQLLHQTLLSSDVISANPEYINIPAYQILAAAKRPFNLPFDLFETEGEMYLEKLGTTKSDLIDAFRKEHDAGAPSASDLAVANAYLELNAAETTLIFQADPGNQANYWGGLAAGTTVELDLFMNATGLSYAQVLELLQLKTINPAADSVIVNDDLSCDTNKKHINNLSPAKFDIIHRFLRLWKKTTMTLEELDAIVQAPKLGNGAISPPLAWKLQKFLQLQKIWSLTVFQYLEFFQNLDTAAPNDLYESLFQNRQVTDPQNPDFAISQVTSGAPIAITDVHKGLILGALGLAPADLATLLAKTDGKLSLANLSFFYRVSQLAQALSLSIGDLLIFLDLINISPFTDPPTTSAFYAKWRTVVSSQFAASDLNYVLRHQHDSSGSLGASDDLVATALGDLQGKLLQAQAATSVQSDPKGDLLKKWLTDPLLNWNSHLVDKLMDILNTQDDDEYKQKIDNNNNFLLNLRVQYHDQILTADLGTLPGGVVFPDSLASQISYDSANRQLQLIGCMSATDQGNLKALSGDLSYKAAVDQLFNAAQQTSSAAANIFFANAAAINANLRTLLSNQIADRYHLFLAQISPSYATLRQQDTVLKEICGWFKINKDIAAAIEGAQPGIYTDLTNAAFVGKAQPLTPANYAAQFNWYQKIAKVCFVTAKLKLTATDLTWLFAHPVDIQSLDFWALPIVPVAGPVTTLASFEVVIQLLKFEQRFKAIQKITAAATSTLSVYTVLDDVINGAALAAVEADLSGLTGWDQMQLDNLINAPNYLNLTPATDLKDVRILLRLAACFDLMSSIRVTSADCVAWSKPALVYADATKIKQTLKAHNQSDQWLSVTQPLQNTLREAKREALIAYLLTNPPAGQNWQTSDDLYSYFLIDVEMTSCQPTSRIVLATNTVQQFVQRCFLNLEKNIVADQTADPDWSQWPWMKNFRVWQANRKVFLYPENWIEPELLPVEIKSPFFKELEDDLLQNEVTNTNVETAFLNYLEKLDGVSRLEIKAMWYEDDKQTLHLVGRTYGGDPKTYFYRKLVQNRRWTPWVKIDQDISSDHVVLTVFNHRIYLFWAIFTEKSREVNSVNIPNTSQSTYTLDKPPKYWQIQMSFTEYKNGKWTPKKVSNNDDTGWLIIDQSWDPTAETYSPAKEDFLFTPLDIPNLDFTRYFDASGKPKDSKTFLSDVLGDIETSLESNGDLRINCYLQESGFYAYQGTFDLDPCKGYPVVTYDFAQLRLTLFDNSQMVNMLDAEQASNTSDMLSVKSLAIVKKTPGDFHNLIALQMGFIDRLINLIYRILYGLYYQNLHNFASAREGVPITVGTFMPYFYQDQSYTYFVQPEFSDNDTFEFTYQDLENLFLAILEGNTSKVHEILATFPKGKQLFLLNHFYNFYHPLVCSFMRILFDQGIDAMMSRPTQLQGDVIFDQSITKFDFNKVYQPTGFVYSGSPITYVLPTGNVTDQHPGYPKGDVDFNPKGGYSLYNWELFFHAPLMIAARLSQNHQFEDADHWFKYILNVTDSSTYPSPDKYWNTKPFFINVNDKYTQQNIENIMLGINSNNSELVQDVTDWRNNPFQPHYIAQYRTVAYQKTTVMKYLDHLIAWGDWLFQQDTMESVNEAEQLYVLADQILGPKPLIIPPAFDPPVDNFAQLEVQLDAFSNALVDIENLLPLQQVTGYDGVNPNGGLPALETFYFCIPPNDRLMKYWDTVAGRLYNIRHCLNLQGVFAPLALFAPPIDPGLLVRAAAAGLDIGSVLSDMNSPLPNYRFTSTIQKAIDLTNEVKALGSGLLQAMEKKDAEDMALLRSKNGLAVLNAVLQVKKQQVEEATRSLEGLQQQQALIQTRIDYYQGLINAGLIGSETASLNLTQAAIGGEQAAVAIEYLGDVLALIPDFDLGASGFGGSPLAAVKFGGTQLGQSMRAMAGAIRGTAGVMHSQANVASTQATYQRRTAEWQFQLNVAQAELKQVEKQILAATVRLAVANKEVDNQQLQIDNAQSEDDFMHSKFTNTDLYAYMIGQLSTTYFQSYQLAYALAKQAEQTFRYELALADSSYINFGYWDSLKKGLLAGERLLFDIRTMEKAYRDQNAREYELTKHISLSQLDASALQLLNTKGECWITLPEELFDMDYPGHYMRRLRSVSVTMPAIVGPYTPVSCTLTMTRNSMRVANTSSGAGTYPRKLTGGVPVDDPRFRDTIGSIQSIVTSTAQNDSGLFEMNFRDERYLPFECAGAISQWHLRLSAAVPQFDYSTIADLVLHVKYTSREGGDLLRGDAITSLQTKINTMLVSLKDTGLMRMFSARHEFPTEWYAFLNPASPAVDQVLSLNITRDRFPYFSSVAANLKIRSIELVADSSVSPINAIQVAPAPLNAPPLNLTADGYYGTMPRLILDYAAAKKNPGAWTITNPAANARLTGDQVNDLLILVHYEVS